MRPSANDRVPSAAGERPQPTQSTPDAPRTLQPWSEEARALRRQHRAGVRDRGRDLTRFREGLASMIVREQEEEERVLGFLGGVLSYIWVPLVYTAAVVVQELFDITSFTVDELAGGLGVSVMIGLLLPHLWRWLPGSDASPHHEGHDPYAVSTVVSEFPSIAPRDDRTSSDSAMPECVNLTADDVWSDCDCDSDTGDSGDSGDGGDAT